VKGAEFLKLTNYIIPFLLSHTGTKMLSQYAIHFKGNLTIIGPLTFLCLCICM